MKLIPVAMIRPNEDFIYAPSKLRKPLNISATKLQNDAAAKSIQVSFDADGVSNPQPVTAYSIPMVGWFIKGT